MSIKSRLALMLLIVGGLFGTQGAEWRFMPAADTGGSDRTLHGVNVAAAAGTCPARPVNDPSQCGGKPCLVDFKRSASATANPTDLQDFKEALGRENTTVRLGPNVELDFSGLAGDFFPIQFGRCATLMSVSAFESDPPILLRTVPGTDPERSERRGPAAISPTGPADRPQALLHGLAAQLAPERGSGRTPQSPGPILRFGTNHVGASPTTSFLEVKCDLSAGDLRDGARLSGVRIFGPSFGYQTTDEVGIRVIDCVDIEISNTEIAGWGGAAISVLSPGARIVSFAQVKIVGNFLHHNQHPSRGSHAKGYGVDVGAHAAALIAENVFDFNRHAIGANGDSVGYEATRNLILKGGGYHGRIGNRWTHQFDMHGNAHSALPTVWCWIKDKPCFWCDACKHASTYDRGDAGHDLLVVANAFQYRNDNAIKIRGRPRRSARIAHNVFPHDGLENDWGDDAIALQTSTNVNLGPGNIIKVDTYGTYGVCDFDGDGVDDLFLATGQTWWYSSFGELPWSYLSARTERGAALRLGYFDNDRRCDVLTERGGEWIVSSGGYGPPQSLGVFGARLSEVQFGRFDPGVRDYRPGVTRRTTHAFRRMSDGEWQVTPLSAPQWQHAQRSRLPMKELRFGDFNGDGVTDVLAVVDGRWSISEGAHNQWRPLNRQLRDDVTNLYIANMDPDDNIDDILRLQRESKIITVGNQSMEQTTLIWWRSKNGVEPWTQYKRFQFNFPVAPQWTMSPRLGFAGRFGAAPGGAVMVIDQARVGRFYGHTETPPEWSGVFGY